MSDKENIQDEIVIFGGNGSSHLMEDLCGYLNISHGACQLIRFSEGTVYVQIDENIRGKDVFIVQSTSDPVNDNFMELLFLLDACRRASAKTVTAIIPYFSYAKGDKLDNRRVSIRARVCADTIEISGANRAVFIDLHAPQIQGFFRIPTDHIQAYPILTREILNNQPADPVIVSPDAGFIKTARLYAKALNSPLAVIDKERSSHDEKAVALSLMGEVKGKRAIIVDDFIASGGTLCNAADLLVSRGATSVWAAITHGLYTKNSMDRIENSSIEKIFVTDSVKQNPGKTLEKIKVVSLAPIIGEIIRRIHQGDSISELFPVP